MNVEHIPQSVFDAAEEAAPWGLHGAVNAAIAAWCEAMRDNGYRLVRDDEATVERMAEAIHDSRQVHAWSERPESWKELYRFEARAALTEAQEEGGVGS